MDIEGASAVERVIMLYEVLVRDLKRVIDALAARSIEDRVNQSNHALDVLQELESMLDMDNGGSTAKDLSRFYSHVRAKILEVQLKQDPAIMERQIGMVAELREGWVAAMAVPSGASGTTETVPLAAGFMGNPYAGVEEGQCCGWSA
jgi:flagellar protein FliS